MRLVRRGRSSRRVAAAPLVAAATTTVALAAALSVALPATATARHADVKEPFRAAHADTCLTSATSGSLQWRATHPPEPAAVEVFGEVTLKNRGLCRFIVPPTAVATFTAYSGKEVVDVETYATIDSDVFSLTLTPDAASPAGTSDIDRVEVAVCHGSSVDAPGTVPTNCGEPVSLTR